MDDDMEIILLCTALFGSASLAFMRMVGPYLFIR
jgi:hypothetical protein